MNFTWGDICVPERGVNDQVAYELKSPGSFYKAGLYDESIQLTRSFFPSNPLFIVQSNYFFEHQDIVMRFLLGKTGYKTLADGVTFEPKRSNGNAQWAGENDLDRQVLTDASKTKLRIAYKSSLEALERTLNDRDINTHFIPASDVTFMHLMGNG